MVNELLGMTGVGDFVFCIPRVGDEHFVLHYFSVHELQPVWPRPSVLWAIII